MNEQSIDSMFKTIDSEIWKFLKNKTIKKWRIDPSLPYHPLKKFDRTNFSLFTLDFVRSRAIIVENMGSNGS